MRRPMESSKIHLTKRKMKEIKFRAWDKKQNLMIHPNRDLDLCMQLSGKLFYSRNPLDGHLIAFANKNFILMQGTGLKDRNGVEIYEGDILSVETWYDNPDLYRTGVLAEVAWSDISCGFKLYPMTNTPSNIYDFNEDDKYTIVGNIYENPNLLEETSKTK